MTTDAQGNALLDEFAEFVALWDEFGSGDLGSDFVLEDAAGNVVDCCTLRGGFDYIPDSYLEQILEPEFAELAN